MLKFIKKTVFYLLLSTCICISGFSQTSITREQLVNFFEYRGDIRTYFAQEYRRSYPNDMMYYDGRLLLWIPNMIDRQFFSDDTVKMIIDLYKKTLALRPPREDRQMI